MIYIVYWIISSLLKVDSRKLVWLFWRGFFFDIFSYGNCRVNYLLQYSGRCSGVMRSILRWLAVLTRVTKEWSLWCQDMPPPSHETTCSLWLLPLLSVALTNRWCDDHDRWSSRFYSFSGCTLYEKKGPKILHFLCGSGSWTIGRYEQRSREAVEMQAMLRVPWTTKITYEECTRREGETKKIL